MLRLLLLLLLLLLLMLLLTLLLLLRVGLDVSKACDPSRDRVVARQQLLQHRHHCRIGWCCRKAQTDARGSALADAFMRCSGARQASSLPLFTSRVQRGGFISHHIWEIEKLREKNLEMDKKLSDKNNIWK